MRKSSEIKKALASVGLPCDTYADVNVAIAEVEKRVSEDTLVLVTGSNFLVAEIEGL